MTRHLDAVQEERQVKKHKAVVRALEFELQGSLETQGATLLGFSVKMEEWEVLMTLRAIVGEKKQIAFVGGEDLIGCILKAVRAARSDKLRWREDQYHQ